MRRIMTAVAMTLLAGPAAAQLPNPSAASVGMANNYSVMARGYAAPAWNPAGLGMPGNPSFSVAIVPVRAVAGLDPVSLEDLAEYDDSTVVPASVKQQWLDDIVREGSERGNGGAGVTYLALSVGRFAFQVGTNALAAVDLRPEAAELILFGNAGRTGEASTIDLAGSQFDVGVVSTAALSYAQPLRLSFGPLPDQHFAVGATVKYTMGHALLSGENMGSRAQADPLLVQLDFPIIQSVAPDSVDGRAVDEASAYDKGTGFGLDVGAMWQGGIFSASVALQNVVNTFEWNEDDMWYRPGQALFDNDTSTSDFDARPLSEAPQPLRDRLDDLGFAPVISVAGAVDLPMGLEVSAEVRRRTGESLGLDTDTHAGVGVEYRPVPFLPLRAGAALVDGGHNLGAGLGLEFGVFNLNVGANRRVSDLGTDWIGAVGMSFGG